ncbi:protease SohB [Halomonas sp. I5-271120]|uniref:protease SohB n=1 Tax=Halomonas sp. I5-271120 TaxID=3061632 RepID=UPI00271473E6|nr:protease SohB [Halomonas sp. I5-271120]
MNEWIQDYALFFAQVLTLLAMLAAIMVLVSKGRGQGDAGSQLRVEELNLRQRKRARRLKMAVTEPQGRKRLLKGFRRDDKHARKKNGEESPRGNVWVLDFHGDLKASGTARLAEEISALLDVVAEGDEVVLRLESAGGLVHAYGLAAAQLDRLREAGVLTRICVDKVAASGGYMMACCADRLQVAPFAVLGSIGVVAQVPNVHRLLKRHDVDVEVLTAGRYKRTLTVLGENTEEGRDKFLADIEHTHELFKRHIAERRPSMDIEQLATGEIWYGREAVDKGLADEVMTSDAYLLARMQDARVLSVRLEAQKRLPERLGLSLSAGVERGVTRLLEAVDASRWLKR